MAADLEKKNGAFSVLMSVYHKENAAFFDLALHSILVEQGLLPTEFVLVCDGPLTPELDAVIDEYTQRFPKILRVFRTENNQGLGKALNYGLEQCRYSLVARADSDDVCDKDRFAEQVRYMDEHPEVSVISSYIDEFDTDWHSPCKKKELPLTHEELAKMAKFRNPINHMAAMFRREDILEIGSYRHVPYIEDYELWVRAIVNGKRLGNVGKVLVHARVGNGMVARRGNRAYIKSWQELSKYMLENQMSNRFEYARNMASIRAFVYMPGGMKEFVYKKILRKK